MKHIYQKFHQHQKLKYFEITPKSKWPEHWIEVNYKGYPRFNVLILPKPSLADKLHFNFFTALLNRKSVRRYSENKPSLQQLSDFLYYSVGLKNDEKRMYASAGGRYPCEVYFIMDRVLWHYHVRSHCLEKMWRINQKNFFNSIAMKWAKKAPIIVIVTAVFARNTSKYKDRGYLYINQEVGAIWQNMYLVATALGMCSCAIGGFKDDSINKIMDLDGELESVMTVMTLGL